MDERVRHPLIPAERVNGSQVFDGQGHKLGHIEDIAIEKLSGKVAYAILSSGGFLGVGERFYPLPWSLLAYDADKDGYVVPMTAEALRDGPSFEREALGGWQDARVRTSIFDYYGPYGPIPFW
jgi:hypothetical protein